MSQQEEYKKLLEQIEGLEKRNHQYFLELETLKKKVSELSNDSNFNEVSNTTEENTVIIEKATSDDLEKEKEAILKKEVEELYAELIPKKEGKSKNIEEVKKPRTPSELEKFIGENLINKIGIAILIIGVVIGVKYSIDNNLISPVTRITLGYLAGALLLFFGTKLKKKYLNFSAVLVGGALASFYFVTYSAYSFYDLFPQAMAFGFMVILTVFSVFSAIKYDKPIIAYLGLVGAYAIPFLLSDGSGRVWILLTYIALVNTGVLVISFKKYWKKLLILSYLFTWLIFTSWMFIDFKERHFDLGLTFLLIFYLQFYVSIVAYRIRNSQRFNEFDVALLLSNSFCWLWTRLLSDSINRCQ